MTQTHFIQQDNATPSKQLYIWGAGSIGQRLLKHLDDSWHVVFVDSNKQLVDNGCCGKKVIHIDDYIRNHADAFIVVAHLREPESIALLQQHQIENYFVHCDYPGELQEPYARTHLKDYVLQYLSGRDDYVLYGLNLYSILIDHWIERQYGIHPRILVQAGVSERFIRKIKENYPWLHLLEHHGHMDDTHSMYPANAQGGHSMHQANMQGGYSMHQTNAQGGHSDGMQFPDAASAFSTGLELCVCTDGYAQAKQLYGAGYAAVTDLYDCTDRIAAYHNPKIEQFHRLHDGKRCFIVATGPSLRIDDLELLKEKRELCISMNNIFRIFDRTTWRPDYYVMDDFRTLNACKSLVDTWPGNAKFAGDTSKEFWETPHRDDVYRYHSHYAYYLDKLPKFSTDFATCSYTGATVTYTCIQLAVYMGFREIYLLGVDFSYGGQQDHTIYSHFYQEEKLQSVGFVRQVYLAYQAAKKYADSQNIKIYNATRGGRLEVFHRIDLDNLYH